MDGAHDVGGMYGFGKVEIPATEPIFREEWQRRVFALTMAALGRGLANLDEFRHSIERMDPAHYLTSSYYEHWLAALEAAVLEKGLATQEELKARSGRAPAPAPAPNPEIAEALMGMVAQGYSTRRETGAAPRFAPGDRVVVKKTHPPGHTRSPRYARGASGIVERRWGAFILPDTSAHGGPETVEEVYCVRFEARELWGDPSKGAEVVFVDLWESYLDGAPPASRTRKPKKKQEKPA